MGREHIRGLTGQMAGTDGGSSEILARPTLNEPMTMPNSDAPTATWIAMCGVLLASISI